MDTYKRLTAFENGVFTRLISEDTVVNKQLRELATSRGDQFLGAATGTYAPGRACDLRNFRLSCGHTQDIRTSHYRNGQYACKTCYHQELEEVAAAQGLRLNSLKVVKYSNHREYIRDCGHTEVFSHNYLQKHKVQPCQVCNNEMAVNNLTAKGFSFVSTIHTGYKISCNCCGLVFNVTHNTARTGTPACKSCFVKNLQSSAAKSGFTFLHNEAPKRVRTNARTSLYYKYVCNTCGYVDYFGTSSMHLGNVRCTGCYTDRLHKDAEKQSMTYVGFVGNGLHKYILSCGCEKIINPYSVRRGIWACREHGNTHFNRENGVYLVQIVDGDFSWLKLGLAKDMKTRIRGYGLNATATPVTLQYRTVESRYVAMEIENALHRKYKNMRLDAKLMKTYMTKGGHTECYPVELLPELLAEFENITGCSDAG